MKTAAELLSILHEAVHRHEGFNWAPVRPADLDAVTVLIRNLQTELELAKAAACHCELGAGGFDLVSHLVVPSRDRPLLAAAAVNLAGT